jgi:hypothetical protein
VNLENIRKAILASHGDMADAAQPELADGAVAEIVAQMPPWERKRWLNVQAQRAERWRFQDTLGAWIATYPWEWFGHLTFRTCRSAAYADRAVRRWLHRLSQRAYGRNYHKRPGEGLWGFCGFERQKRGDWHGHVCVAGTNRLDPLEGKRAWDHVKLVEDQPHSQRMREEIQRIARVYPYRGEGGAHYGAKYASKEAGGDAFWRMYGNWRDQADLPLLAHDSVCVETGE